MAQTIDSTQDELTRRHRVAAMTVVGMMVLTLLLAGLALSGMFVTRAVGPDPSLVWSLRILIVFLLAGAYVLRRVRFNVARLQDIASVRGTSALLATLQNTTRLVALIGGAIAVLGFVLSTMTFDLYDVLRFVIAALAVLFYAYPRREAWRRVVEATRTGGEP